MPCRLDTLPTDLMDEVLDYVGRHNLTPATFMGKMKNKYRFNRTMNKLYLKYYEDKDYEYNHYFTDGDEEEYMETNISGKIFSLIMKSNFDISVQLLCNMNIKIGRYEHDDYESINYLEVNDKFICYFADTEELEDDIKYDCDLSRLLKYMDRNIMTSCLWCREVGRNTFDTEKISHLIDEQENEILGMIFDKDKAVSIVKVSVSLLNAILPMVVKIENRKLMKDGEQEYVMFNYNDYDYYATNARW